MSTSHLEQFTCTTCHRSFPWMLRGGTSLPVEGERADFCDKNVTECAYCQGTYPDGTGASGAKK